jgi:ketosteroid isomerase-like protein
MSTFSRLLAFTALLFALTGPCVAETTAPLDKAQVEKELWAKEQAIYAGRGRGDLQPYYDNTSPAYLGWPPQVAEPMGRGKLRPADKAAMGSKEKLEMKFSALALSGDSALIYYKTHMTMRSDGTPVDLRYEVIHAWVREGGQWRLLGGMARPAVDR